MNSFITKTTYMLLFAVCSNAFTMPTRNVPTTSSLNMMMDPSDLASFAHLSSSTNILADIAAATTDALAEPTYSKFSYYTTLGLYVMSFPGIWSQIKRSTSAKLKRKTYLRLVEQCIFFTRLDLLRNCAVFLIYTFRPFISLSFNFDNQ